MEKSTFDPQTGAYLRQADATFRNGFEDEEIKKVFLDNVFEEIKGSEIKLSLMKSTCFIVEQFIAAASSENILQLLKSYSSDFKEVSENQQGCHVLQKTLQRFIHLLNESNDGSNDGIWMEIFDVVVSLSKTLTDGNELANWMCHTYSTHIARSVLETLGGVMLSMKGRKQELKNENNQDTIVQDEKLPTNFLKMFKQIIKAFASLEKQKLVEIMTLQNGTPCVCVMLRVSAIRSPKALKQLCEKILSVCENNRWNTLLILAKDRIGSHVIESLLESGQKETFLKLFEIFCSDQEKLLEFSCHPVTNFIVQKFIISPTLTDQQFEVMLVSLLASLEEIFSEQRFGVVQKLAERCVEIKSCQFKFVKSLLQAFHCKEEDRRKYLVSLIASSSPFDTIISNNKDGDSFKVPSLPAVRYHGSLLLQTLLLFDNPIKVTRSLSEIPAEHIVRIACDVSGSHFIDAFFTSQKIIPKRKMLCMENIKDKLHEIACDKYGSRVMDNIWKHAHMKMKIVIAESLAKHEHELTSQQFGKHVYRKFGIKQFSMRREDWKEFQTRQTNKRKMFEEFFPTTKPTSGGKKKKIAR